MLNVFLFLLLGNDRKVDFYIFFWIGLFLNIICLVGKYLIISYSIWELLDFNLVD